MATGATLRRRLVRQLQDKGLLQDTRLRDAFLEVPREQFVPDYAAEHGLEAVYRDDAILTKKTETGLGLSSSSQPGIMAEMLGELRLEPGQRVLEIGAGTGYNAALLQQIVGDEGRVISVDIDPDAAQGARRALKGTRVKVVTGDGRVGYAAGAPYDRIIVTASATEIPRAWLEQLTPGGLLEVPLRVRDSAGLQLIPTLRRDGERLRSVAVICGGFMPLRDSPDDLSRFGPVLNIMRTDGGATAPLLVIAGLPVRSGQARRLVATACSEPRPRRLPVRASSKALDIYLALRGPSRRMVAVFDGKSYLGGIVARDGRSLALLAGWPTTSKMLVYGQDEAADELERLVHDWVDRGRPDAAEVELTASFSDGTSSIRTHWRGR
jgi:protein-L-isoaspartate(D-aspartate) O-methyltransferase